MSRNLIEYSQETINYKIDEFMSSTLVEIIMHQRLTAFFGYEGKERVKSLIPKERDHIAEQMKMLMNVVAYKTRGQEIALGCFLCTALASSIAEFYCMRYEATTDEQAELVMLALDTYFMPLLVMEFLKSINIIDPHTDVVHLVKFDSYEWGYDEDEDDEDPNEDYDDIWED